MKAVLILLLAFLPELAFSQKAVPYATELKVPAQVTKLVRVRYADARTIAALIAHQTPVNVNADNTLKAIVLHGEPSTVASVEQLIRELDAPTTAPTTKDIEVLVSVIGASSSSEVPASGEMPEGMTPVIKQLRVIFPYKNYRLLSSMLMRSREGSRTRSQGIMKSSSNVSRPTDYLLAYQDASVVPENGRQTIHLERFQFNTRVPLATGSAGVQNTQFQMADVGISTDIDLREGQKTVVGKADIGSSDSALFVVLTARLVD